MRGRIFGYTGTTTLFAGGTARVAEVRGGGQPAPLHHLAAGRPGAQPPGRRTQVPPREERRLRREVKLDEETKEKVVIIII